MKKNILKTTPKAKTADQRSNRTLWKMKKALHFLPALLFLAMAAAVTSCSDDEDYTIGEESPAVFFEKNLPQEKVGEGTNVTEVPFSGFNNDGNVCVVLNSYNELNLIYQGEDPLPEVDFSKYSLVIGRVWLNVGLKFNDLTVSKDGGGNTVVTLDFTYLSDNATIALVTYYYYWALCPKFSPQNITTRINYDH